MKHIQKQSPSARRWMGPLLASISMIDITLGSLSAGASLAQGPDARGQAALSFGLLSMGCLSFWILGQRLTADGPLTDQH